MEGTYTCVRCWRALTLAVRSTTIPRAAKSTFSGRSLSSLAKSSDSNSTMFAKPTRLLRPEKLGRHRLAHTAVAGKETSNTVERPKTFGSEYGEYRPNPRTVLGPGKLFHPFTRSPIPEVRQRAAFIERHAYCPHPSHHPTRMPTSPHDPESRKGPGISTAAPAHVRFECPDCGIATYCTEEHWADDYESHLEICDTLRQINEDDHDLRSGRWFPEFEYPGPQMDEFLVNMTSWDTYLYTRQFEAINEDRSMRHTTRLLTYPLTIGSILHELSPYDIRPGGRLTTEGLKSLSGECQRLGRGSGDGVADL